MPCRLPQCPPFECIVYAETLSRHLVTALMPFVFASIFAFDHGVTACVVRLDRLDAIVDCAGYRLSDIWMVSKQRPTLIQFDIGV